MTETRHVIVSALVRRAGEILLVEQQGPRDPAPSWMLPGGRVEPGERLEEALRRELSEETGLHLAGAPEVAFVADLATDAGHYRATTFTCEASGTLAPADPDGYVRRAAWVPADEAIRRLKRVDWYDSTLLEQFLGTAPPDR